MKHYKDEMERIIYEEFGDVLDVRDEKIYAQEKKLEAKDKEIKTKDKEIKTKDKEIEKLTKYKKESKAKLRQVDLDNIDLKEAKKLINSLLLL